MMTVRHVFALPALAACAVVALVGCATQPAGPASPRTAQFQRTAAPRTVPMDPALADRILALDPERISENDVRATLAYAPTPRIILVHGSVYPAPLLMRSFATFLEGMGYPAAKLRDPADGSYSQWPYESSERLAGAIAWYYEHDGVRPMMIGHSQGGMQVVKVLYQLAGEFEPRLAVWNPAKGEAERRYTIVDPVSHVERSVVGLSVAYAASVGAGGAAFMLPNQWQMLFRLHNIPDTVEEFTGFAIQGDTVAWTLAGTPASGDYRTSGAAKVRNVVLPLTYNHIMVPVTHTLATDPRTRNWINAYLPGRAEITDVPDDVKSFNVLWAADVWFSVKKHWTLEAQRLVRARRAASDSATVDVKEPRAL
jgi:hypothetical protein